jgi:predicted DNA-binding transcriptional regulator AlpA
MQLKIIQPGNSEPIPEEIRAIVHTMLGLLINMHGAAKDQAKHHPSPAGFYPVAVLIDDAGNIVSDANGQPVVLTLPLVVHSIEDKTVTFRHPDEKISPKDAAALAGVSLSTIKRLVGKGDLNAPVKLSKRRTAFHLADVQEWMARNKLPRRRP